MISMEIMKRSRYLPVRMSNSLIWRQEVEAIMISNWLQEGWQLTHSRPATIDGKFKFWWAGKLPSSVWPRALGGLQEKRCKYGSEIVMWLVIFLLRWPGPALRLAEWVVSELSSICCILNTISREGAPADLTQRPHWLVSAYWDHPGRRHRPTFSGWGRSTTSGHPVW